jgi:muramoyltetrapeptide carboxypeptidase LdcA involved in peptidoglycan recycling
MPNTLKGSKYLYSHPEQRAADLMQAFEDKSVKAIFSCIGGNESVRMLPYIDYEVIRRNPKIFIGYSDSTVAHMICLKAGISSFYGPSILAEFAENVEMYDYTKRSVEKALYSTGSIGEIKASPIWTSEYLPWEEKNKDTKRKMQPNTGHELLQGSGIASGRLIGGCIEVLEMLKGTEIWPDAGTWDNTILFFETSEEKPSPQYVESWLRNYGSQGILNRISGMIFGKPYDNLYYEEYKSAILRVVRDELKLKDLPILYNMNFGHTAPMAVLPYGAMAQIDCIRKSFTITESGVV